MILEEVWSKQVLINPPSAFGSPTRNYTISCIILLEYYQSPSGSNSYVVCACPKFSGNSGARVNLVQYVVVLYYTVITRGKPYGEYIYIEVARMDCFVKYGQHG